MADKNSSQKESNQEFGRVISKKLDNILNPEAVNKRDKKENDKFNDSVKNQWCTNLLTNSKARKPNEVVSSDLLSNIQSKLIFIRF